MYKTLSHSLTRKLPTAAVYAPRPLSSTTRNLGILFNDDKNDPQDGSKQPTDTIAQAKNDEGNTPAQQHASAQGHPVNEGSGNPQPSKQASEGNSPGLGSKHAMKGEKPGEEAVNPAVKGS